LIDLKDIKAVQGSFTLNIGNLSIRKGELTAILGNNGSGKSTFLGVLSGLRDFTGRYTLQGEAFKDIKKEDRARLIGFLPQAASLNMPFDAFYVVLTGRFIYTGGLRYSEEDVRHTERAMKAFDVFHLKDRLFNELSGGEKQRVLLARVINMDSDIFLLDEPLSGIDILHQIKAVEIFKRLAMDKIIAVVIHDLSFAIQHFSRFLFFRDGSLLYDMNRDELVPGRLSDVFGVKVGFVEQDQRRFVYTEEI
jgi:iron complex transport system ATP-binding protein